MKRKNTDGDDVVEEEAMIDDDPSSDESNTKTKSTLKPLCTPFFTKISQDGKGQKWKCKCGVIREKSKGSLGSMGQWIIRVNGLMGQLVIRVNGSMGH